MVLSNGTPKKKINTKNSGLRHVSTKPSAQRRSDQNQATLHLPRHTCSVPYYLPHLSVSICWTNHKGDEKTTLRAPRWNKTEERWTRWTFQQPCIRDGPWSEDRKPNGQTDAVFSPGSCRKCSNWQALDSGKARQFRVRFAAQVSVLAKAWWKWNQRLN